MANTPAERHDELVKMAADRYVKTYLMVMKMMSAGGRTPGLAVPQAETVRQFFEQTNPSYWQQLPQDEAQSQIRQWASAGGE